MKRIAEFIFLSIAFICISCSKDSENPTEETGAVYGIVIDADSGLPISNVTVELYELYSIGYKKMVGSSITGNDGSFTFVDITPCPSGHILMTSHAAYVQSSKHISIKSGKEIQVSMSISSK